MQAGAPRLEDRLGPGEPQYRSRGEAQVGRLLDRYGIPFFYEQPLVLQEQGQRRVYWPDFTLPTYGHLIVEYAGMPDRPEYMARAQRKQAAYAANAVPSLFLYPSDLAGRDWPERIVQRIGDIYRQPRIATRYPAMSGSARLGGPRLSYSRRCVYRR